MAPPREVLEAEERADLELAALQDEAKAEAERRHDELALFLFGLLAWGGDRSLSPQDIAELRQILRDYSDRVLAAFEDVVTRARQRAHDQARRDVSASWLAISGVERSFAREQQHGLDLADELRTKIVVVMGGYITAAVVQRARWIDVARQLAGPAGSVTASQRGRVANAVDLDASLVYGGTSQACMDLLLSDQLLKQDVETIDRRNHPISRVLNGQAVPIQQPFRAPLGEVRSAAASMGKPMGGVFWPEVDGAFQGMTLPAHFGERGRVRLTTRGWL